ncbi:hypothetical protein [Chitinophaga pinensis]|uniref:Uncharacterized protein n=1 Tax=Chitinophaga pinensis (strain ATCC 43595 / DSM 2588 / LMG 13176 / NBRC 15968 / NCIMB 11800 / UQM 2034) TaxID=485918 RepID=A0A979G1W7_CHIPD|nr:hypothetical protein [Chitinophaga pinensis]ACU59355.1 hypothetical protein Cpin_1859 [Chitinophaga pinensis DSM 2588]
MTTLKKCLLASFALVAVCLSAGNSHAQSLKDFFGDESTPLTYLGVDFSATKVEGEAATGADIVNKFEPINSVIVVESKKYDVAGTFRRASVTNSLDAVKKVNAAVSPDKIKTDAVGDVTKGLTTADIEKHVKQYDLSGKKGIGLVFIMDGMSKTNKEAYIYATLIDLSTKKVLLSERITGKAQGFGFRNYWAYTIYKVLNSIDHGRYKEWKSKSTATADTKVAIADAHSWQMAN